MDMHFDEPARFLVRAFERYVTVPLPWESQSLAALAYMPDQLVWYRIVVLFMAANAVRSTIDRAWPSSRVGLGADRIRQAARSAAVASAAVLVLQQAATRTHDGPLVWVLPLVSGIGGICAALAADPIARAWKAKRGR